MIKTFEIQINNNHKLYEWCDNVCFKGKNLYNFANYHIRQSWIAERRFLSYMDVYKLVSKSEPYYDFGHTSIAGQVLRDVYDVWKSYMSSLKSYKKSPSSFKSIPNMPRYKHKENGRFQVCYVLSGTAIPVNKHYKTTKVINFLGKLKSSINLPKILDDKNIKEIVVLKSVGCYSILFNYIEDVEIKELGFDKVASIDLGLSNLCTLTFNDGNQPEIYSGKNIKTINQSYNKKLAYLKSRLSELDKKNSKQISKITRKRNNRIKDNTHKVTRTIVDRLVENKTGVLIIGNNVGWKTDINIGKRNNQNFVSIPHYKIIQQLRYKFEEVGGRVILNEESYTSKASFLDMDFIPTYGIKSELPIKFSGRRIGRLYTRSNGMIINADVNASYNIMRKADPNAVRTGNLGGLKVNPLVVNVNLSTKNDTNLQNVA